MVALTLVVALLLVSMAGDVAAEEQCQDVTLYLSGSSLTIEEPDAGGETVSIRARARPVRVTVGTWETAPLQKSMELNGTLSAEIWASGTGRVDFRFEFLVNGNPVDVRIDTGTMTLTGGTSSFSGSVSNAQFTVNEGDTLGVEVSMYYSASLGVTVYYGSQDHPSAVAVPCDSIFIDEVEKSHDSTGQKVRFSTIIIPAFGPEDIVDVNISIDGPNGADHVTRLDDNASLEPIWVWKYGKDGAEGDYEVVVRVVDRNGNTWTSNATMFSIGPRTTTTWVPSPMLLIGIIIVALIIVVIVYKLYLEDKVNKLRTSTKYWGDYKRLVAAEVLHDFSWNILLMYSAFILAQSANPQIGNFFVGLNFALYQTVAVFFALGITKRSDQKARRRNPLIASVTFGGLILLAASGTTFVPLFITLFVLYMVCFYTKEMLEVAIVTEYFPSALRGKAYGILVAVANVGAIIGGAASGYLYEFYGMWLCLILSGVALLASVAILWDIRDVGIDEPHPMSQWLKEVLASVRASGQWLADSIRAISAEAIDRFLFEFQNRKVMQLIFLSLVLVSIGSGMINPFVVVFLVERSVSETMIGFVYTLIGLAVFMPVNQLVTGVLVDKFTARKVFVGSIIIYILLWGAFNLAVAVKTSFLAILAIYSYPIWPFLYISSRLFASDVTPRSERARGITLTRFAMGIGFVIASISGGVMLYLRISYETVFLFAMLFIFIAVVIAILTLKASKGVTVREDDPDEATGTA
jgi:MFS family permease